MTKHRVLRVHGGRLVTAERRVELETELDAQSDQGYTLAVVAMASAAVAAFFYLRLAVTMFSPVGDTGDVVDATVPGELAVTGSPPS